MSDNLEPITPQAAPDYHLETQKYDLSDETYRSHRYRLESFVGGSPPRATARRR